MKIVDIAPDRPMANDMVGQLRRLADRIEKGEHKPPYLMLIIPPEDRLHWPHVVMYGTHPSDLERDGLLAQAQAFMTIHKVARVG